MKFQNTSRLLSFLFHSLIVLGFGALGVYFAFFVVPQYFSSHYSDWTETLVTAPYFLYLEFAVLGLAFFGISIYGAIQGYFALARPRDDEPVVKSLTAFIVEGWILSIAFLLHGVLLFDLLANGENFAFTVIMALIFAIIFLIATNIPMVKLYEGRDQTLLLRAILLGFGLVTALIALLSFSSLAAMLAETSFAKKAALSQFLGTLIVQNAVASGLSFGAAFLLKGGKKKTAGYLASGAVFALAAGLIVFGSLDMLYYDKSVHMNLVNAHIADPAQNGFGYGFPIMAIVIGAVLLVATAYLIWYSSVEHKKPVHRA